MPRIDTSEGNLQGIDSILRQSGLKENHPIDFEGKLQKARLGTQTLLEGVADIVSNGDTDNARLQALKIGLQLNSETRKAMNDETGKQTPVFNIIIRDAAGPVQVNAVLMPRRNNILEIEPEDQTL